MGVNSLPKTVTRQHRGCDLNPGPSAPESSLLTTRYQTKKDTERQTDRQKVQMTQEIVICEKVINKATLFTICKEQMTRNVPVALTGISTNPKTYNWDVDINVDDIA